MVIALARLDLVLRHDDELGSVAGPSGRLAVDDEAADRHAVEVEVEAVEVRGRRGGDDRRRRPDVRRRVVRAGDVVVPDVVATVAGQGVVAVTDARGASREAAVLLAGVVCARERGAQRQCGRGRRCNRSGHGHAGP